MLIYECFELTDNALERYGADECMGVDEDPHSIDSRKSSNGASKSGAIYFTVP